MLYSKLNIDKLIYYNTLFTTIKPLQKLKIEILTFAAASSLEG
jgi:hypothetical protein